MRRQIVSLSVALGLASGLAAGAPAAPQRAAGVVQLRATFPAIYRFGDACPADAPKTLPVADCVRFVGGAFVPGLGRATSTYIKTIEDTYGCDAVTQWRTATIAVAGKGEIFLTGHPTCGPFAPAEVGPFEVTIIGGSGIYSGASGSLRFSSSVYPGDMQCGPCGSSRDTWMGTLAVPGLEFDVVPPMLDGARAKTVRAPRGSNRVRVRYAVTASDAVDGSVAVGCTPRPGSYFKRGSTRVTCSATDSSGNTSRRTFTVTVR